jgi:small subunit ribosomal protein S21
VIEIRLNKREDVQRGLRRLKKAMVREKVFDELRKRRHFEKPSSKRRAKLKAARFNAMLRQRHSEW